MQPHYLSVLVASNPALIYNKFPSWSQQQVEVFGVAYELLDLTLKHTIEEKNRRF